MAGIENLLYIGDLRLYERCDEVLREEKVLIKFWKAELRQALKEANILFGYGQAIAGPQLGIMRRVIYLHNESPKLWINPSIISSSNKMVEIWDDCYSIPHIKVKVERNQSIDVQYFDERFRPRKVKLSGDRAFLIQHEVDHLNGILCTMRAKNNKAFAYHYSLSTP